MRFTAWLVLIATLLIWSGNWIVARAVRAEVSPAVATVGRLLVVLLILAPFAFAGLRSKWAGLSRRDWKILAALGLAGGGPHLALQWLGLHYTTAASGILYLSTTPIFILLLSRPLLGERMRPARWAGVAVSFCGVFLIATQGDPAALSFNRGDLMALASMVMWASYTVLLRVRGGRLRLHAAGTLAVLYSAIGSLLLAYAGWSYVVARLGAARAGVTLHLMPALGVLLSMLFLGEYPRWYHFAGIALILAGVAASSLKGSSASSSR